MPTALPDELEREIAGLAQRFGTPLVRAVAIGTETFWRRHTESRTCEVCMVMRRPNGRLLTASKIFYPEGTYRLMTGGVEPGERVLDALLRETYEETGLHIAIRRLLAVVAYRSAETDSGSEPCFFTVAFLLDERGGTLGATDPNERLLGYREVAPEELPTIAEHLDALPDVHDEILADNWRDWGRFRAVIHRTVWDALNMDD